MQQPLLLSECTYEPFSPSLRYATMNSICYRTKLGSTHPFTVKATYWHWVVVKESAAFIVRTRQEVQGSSCSKKPISMVVFREQFSYEKYGGVWPSGSGCQSSVWGPCACAQTEATVLLGGGFNSCRKTQRFVSVCCKYPLRRSQDPAHCCSVLSWLLPFVSAFPHFSYYLWFESAISNSGKV